MFSRLILLRSVRKSLGRYYSSQAHPQTYIYNLLSDTKCRSCGIQLQDKFPDKPGYYRLPGQNDSNTDKKAKTSELNKKYEKILQNLDISDRNLLINNFSAPKQDDEKVASVPSLQQITPVEADTRDTTKDQQTHLGHSLSCKRCNDVIYNSKTRSIYDPNRDNLNKSEFPIPKLQQVLSTIPVDAPLVYVFSANDFPMGINKDIFQYRPPQQIYFVMTKSDILIPKTNVAFYNNFKKFLQNYMFKKFNVPRENVFIASGKDRWKMTDLYHFIPNYSYIIGDTNCGKSTLVKSLLINHHVKHWKYEARQQRPDEKQSSSASLKNKDFKKLDRLIDSFSSKNGPGTSHIPGFTRDVVPVDIDGIKELFDVPGFTTNGNLQDIFDKLNHKQIARITKGANTSKYGSLKSKFDTVKNGQVLSLNGVGYLQFPGQDSMYQIRNVTKFALHKFKNLEKVDSILQRNEIPKSMSSHFIVNRQQQQQQRNELRGYYKRYIIPPFYGTIDLVIKDIGYINIKPTGKKLTNELMVLYLHPSLEAIIRQPILNYIDPPTPKKSPDGTNRKTITSDISKTPFYSRLIPSTVLLDPSSLVLLPPSSDYNQLNQYLQIDESSETAYNDLLELDETNKYDYWIE